MNKDLSVISTGTTIVHNHSVLIYTDPQFWSPKGLASHVQAKKNITRTFLIWVQLGPVDCLFIRTLQPSLHPNPIKSTIKSWHSTQEPAVEKVKSRTHYKKSAFLFFWGRGPLCQEPFIPRLQSFKMNSCHWRWLIKLLSRTSRNQKFVAKIFIDPCIT